MSTLPIAAPSTCQMFVTTAIMAWDQWSVRAGKLFDSISDERMLLPLAPGKNRPVYILGHLISVDEGLIPQLRLGETAYPHYRDIFVMQPDGAVVELPSIAELRQSWKDAHARLDDEMKKLAPEEWLERHSSVAEEDFAKEPHRNRIALLHSRTAHLAYHVGQLLLFKSNLVS